MPGLFGYLTKSKEKCSPVLISAMAASMQHQPGLKIDSEIYPGFSAGRVHLGYFQPDKQPRINENGRYYLWLDGEFNNAPELIKNFNLKTSAYKDHAQIAILLFEKLGWSFLLDVDGMFNIALYDRDAHQLTLVNDCFGLRPLYWVKTPHGFAYAGEVKALLGIPGLKLQIDRQAVDEWFSFGYLLGDRTWIEGIELYPPATIMHVSTEGIRTDRYWSWEDIQPMPDNVREDEIAEELGRLWIKAVQKRVDEKQLGQTLSGGLDSRAILAALPTTKNLTLL